MNAKPLVTIHNSNDLAQVLEHSASLLILVCKTNYETFHEQLEIIREVGHVFHQTLKVGLVAEEFAASFCGRYDVKGTPTFLFFMGGVEQDRILGFMDRESLIARVNMTMESCKA